MTAAQLLPPALRNPGTRARPRTLPLTAADASSLQIWILTRLSLLAISLAARWVMQGSNHTALSWAGLWQHWDASILTGIAAHGYGTTAHDIAFFPGYPLALSAVHLLLPNWIASELLLSFAAGAVASVALGRLASPRAVWFLACSPAAVFLTAGYTESLFLAFALPAWLAARNNRYYLAGLLSAAAVAVRIDGLFLLAAVAVMAYLDSRRIRCIMPLSLGVISAAGYEAFLWLRTGDPMAWLHAEREGWGRHFVSPVTSWHSTWTYAAGHVLSAPMAFTFQLELAAAVTGVLATVVLLWLRRWPEAVYCGLVIGALITSPLFMSVPRALLIAFPFWAGLSELSERKPWAGQMYLAVSVPLAVIVSVLYLSGSWAG